jgi:Escherichia/Staphylococcus phage prohead protease
MSTTERKAPEQRTIDVDVHDLDTRGRTVVGYAALYNTLSEDLGGYREQIAPGAFAGVLDADVRALLNHDPNEVLGRTKSGTLRLHDEERGLRFELDLPDSPLGQNMRTAISRGDLDGASFRFEVGDEAWDGDVRTIKSVKELRDVTLATYPAYPAASVELRTKPTTSKEATMDESITKEVEDAVHDEPDLEQRTNGAGSLRVTDRDDGRAEARTLYGQFQRAGWSPGERTEIAWLDFENATESRALTWTGSVDLVNRLEREAGPFGFDQRYAWPAFPRVPVDDGVTSVNVLTQTARTLPSAATVVRAIDAVTNKPEAASTVTVVTTSMKQLAAVQSGVPNVMMVQPGIERVIGRDLRLSFNEGLDKLILDAIALSGFQAPGTDPLLVSIRKAMTTLYAAGYNPDTLILTPAAAEALDVLVTGIASGVNDYVFAPANFAPDRIFGMQRRMSKTIPATAVVDAQAFGRLYAGPVALASFEENAGKTNSSLVRFEGNAVFGTERQNAAIRIAAS